jgi:hypothetical protein
MLSKAIDETPPSRKDATTPDELEPKTQVEFSMVQS